MIAMGVGVLPVDADMWAVAQACIGNDTVGAQPFLLTLGAFKVLSVAGLWGYGLFPKNFAYLACAIPPICAVYGHTKLKDGKAPGAGIYLLMLAVTYYLEGKKGSASTKKD